MSVDSRFWSHVNKTPHCWEWTACLNDSGYGVIGLGGREAGIERAHRLSWILHFGPIPANLCVLHKCDNRKCVRPDHLFLGTRLDNNLDMTAKGRNRYDVPLVNHNAKITPEIVHAIRERYQLLPPRRHGRVAFTQQLADEYGLDISQVRNIASGRQWRQVGVGK